MNKSRLFILTIIVCLVTSCGPSAESMAKKSCALYQKYDEASQKNDTATMSKIAVEIGTLDKELTEEYMHKNPEWLMKYVKLRDECILKKTK